MRLVSTKSLECHHIEGIRWDALESADTDKCRTYCSSCHKKVHQIEGCKYSDMWCTPYDQLDNLNNINMKKEEIIKNETTST